MNSMGTLIHSRRGQTLVEALVALSILTTGFIGVIALLNKSFQLNRTTTNDTQATYLAAEGIEIAKNIIDHDVYYGFANSADKWECSFLLKAGQSQDYALDYEAAPSACDSPRTVAQAGGNQLYLNPGTGLYSYSAAPPDVPTDFTRDVRISVPNGSPNELDVQSKVAWTDGALSNTITLEDHFYNWHPQ